MFSQQVEKFQGICGQSLDRVAWAGVLLAERWPWRSGTPSPWTSKERVQGVESYETRLFAMYSKRKSRAVIPTPLAGSGRNMELPLSFV
jgi:hypothetical protein